MDTAQIIDDWPGDRQGESRSYGGARVDDYLIERSRLRDKFVQMLDSVPAKRRPGGRLLRTLHTEACSGGESAAKVLVDLFLHASATTRAEAARLVLQGLPISQLQAAVQSALSAPALPGEQQRKLADLLNDCVRRKLEEERYAYALELQYTPPELVEAFLETLEETKATEPEAVALVWQRGLKDVPAPEKLDALKLIVAMKDPRLLPVLEVEARSSSAAIRRMVAASLTGFPYEESLHLAVRMEFDTDVTARYDAGKAEQTLRKLRRLPMAAPAPEFCKCFCLALPEQGSAALVYAARSTDGSLKFCSVLIDTWHRGIVDAWGNVGFTDEEFAEVVVAFSGQAALMETTGARKPKFTALSCAEAVAFIHEGAAVTRSRGRRLPEEFPVWERLFRHVSENEEDYRATTRLLSQFSFDLHCDGCAKPVSVNRNRTNVLFGKGLAFCSRCASNPRSCASCGTTFRLRGVSARRRDAAFSSGCCGNCL